MKLKKRMYFKEILLKKRKEILDIIDSLSEDLKNTQTEQNESSKYSSDMEDISYNPVDQSSIIYLMQREEKYLQQIENALSTINDGTYGTCKICGKEIGFERLVAVPTTSFCISCKQNQADKKTEFIEKS